MGVPSYTPSSRESVVGMIGIEEEGEWEKGTLSSLPIGKF